MRYMFHIIYTQHCYDDLVRNLFIQCILINIVCNLSILDTLGKSSKFFNRIIDVFMKLFLKLIILPSGSSIKSRDILSYI